MKFSFYIAKRYAFSKSKSKAINIITAISAMGIVVSAMAMFVVLSVFSGLREYSLSFTNNFDAELTLFAHEGKSFVASEEQLTALNDSGLFSGMARVVEDRLLFNFHEKQMVAYIKGVDTNFAKVSQYEDSVEYGQWFAPDSEEVVVGVGMSYMLGMGLYDTEGAFNAVALKPGTGVINDPKQAFIKVHLTPVGIYLLENEELDAKYVFSTLEVAQELLSLEADAVTNIAFKLAAGVSEASAITQIKKVFGDQAVVKNRMQLNDSLYRMLNTENAVVYLIFLLVIIIALFNLIGALIMIILEKQPNIKTLNGLGVRMVDLRRIFLYQGMIISVLGGLLGIALGAILVVLQDQFAFVMINPSLPYPIQFNFTNIGLVLLSILVLGFLASYIASSRVNKTYLQ